MAVLQCLKESRTRIAEGRYERAIEQRYGVLKTLSRKSSQQCMWFYAGNVRACTCEPKGVGDAAGKEVQAIAGGHVGGDGHSQTYAAATPALNADPGTSAGPDLWLCVL